MANIDELKSTGLKATLPRLKILDVFHKGTQRHMTAEDVFKALLAEGAPLHLDADPGAIHLFDAATGARL